MRLPGSSPPPASSLPPHLKKMWPWLVLAAGAGIFFFTSLREDRKQGGSESTPSAPVEAKQSGIDAAEFKRGYELSKQVCQSCHLYPEAELMDRFTWTFEVLPRMAFWLGFEKYDFDKEPGGQRIKEANIVPTAPILEFKDWHAICSYYASAAPLKPLPPIPHAPIKIGLKHFQPIIVPYPRKPQNLLIQIVPGANRVYIGNEQENTVDLFNLGNNKVEATVKFDSPPVCLSAIPQGMFVTLMGSFAPSDEPLGKLIQVSKPGVAPPTYREILTKLQRPTDTLVVDLNKDGRDDLVICEYGNILGRFCWWENLGSGKYQEHVLLERCGAEKVQLYDVNRDGLMDIVVMMAQAREGIYLFLNQGKGEFEMQPIAEYPSCWGSVYFELADFNRDGFIDVLAANGDNGDMLTYPYITKRYHGLRIYLNDGKNKFKEASFYPINGAYKAVARDFDHDGDLDIVAISYFPDYERSRAESCVYLENKGDLKFEPYSFPASISGKWIAMDAADVDGDGDIDVVLGAFNGGPGVVPQLLRDAWDKQGTSILFLKNTIKP